MSQYNLAFSDIVTASLFTLNGNVVELLLYGPRHDFTTFLLIWMPPSARSFAALTAGSMTVIPARFTVTQETIGTVPEPATWAMLVLGFGGIGAMLRLARRRQHIPAAAA